MDEETASTRPRLDRPRHGSRAVDSAPGGAAYAPDDPPTGWVEPANFEGLQLGYREFETGLFSRQFTLSDEVDVNAIEAKVREGVLEIRLPKVESARRRKVLVKAG